MKKVTIRKMIELIMVIICILLPFTIFTIVNEYICINWTRLVVSLTLFVPFILFLSSLERQEKVLNKSYYIIAVCMVCVGIILTILNWWFLLISVYSLIILYFMQTNNSYYKKTARLGDKFLVNYLGLYYIGIVAVKGEIVYLNLMDFYQCRIEHDKIKIDNNELIIISKLPVYY